MARFTLYRGDSAPIDDATEHLRSSGVKIIASRPGLALVDTTLDNAEKLKSALSGWSVTPEHAAKIPSPRPKMPRKK